MRLMPHELKRLRQHATLLKKISTDTKLDVTKKALGEFQKDVLATLQYKKQIKNLLLVLVETDKEDE